MPEPPLFLSTAEIAAALEDGLAALGAIGGGVGGAIGAGLPGALGGASGGRSGARFGARFTRQDSRRRHWPQPSTPELVARLRAFLQQPQDRQLTVADGTPVLGMVGIVGSGSMNLNPCLVEAVWDATGLQVVAHAKEGLIKQRTCEKALNRLQEEVFRGR